MIRDENQIENSLNGFKEINFKILKFKNVINFKMHEFNLFEIN